MDAVVSTIVEQSKAVARQYRRERGLLDSIGSAGGPGPENVKVYASSTDEYAALFVVVSLGSADTAMHMVNIYGSFDPARIGGSVNLPPSEGSAPMGMSNPSSAPMGMSNPMMMQMIAFKGDEAGQAFFANPNGPPPCPAFNYCVVTMSLGANGTFGIKPSAWQEGAREAYTFKLSELKPLTMQDLGSPGLWCKAPTAKVVNAEAPASAVNAEAPASAVNAEAPASAATPSRATVTPAMIGGIVAAVLLLVLGLALYASFGKRRRNL